MNERIKEFAKECTQWVTGTLDGDYEYFDKEKFAELIVRECLFIIDDERKPDMVNRTELWHQIVEHFGVE